MSTRKVTTVLVLNIFFSLVPTDGSPLFLWGIESPSKPALKAIEQIEFESLLEPLLMDHAIVAFIEPNLTTKDFLYQNAETGHSSYAFMKNIRPQRYYIDVLRPIEALLAVGKEIINVTANEIEGVEQNCPLAGTVSFINFNTDNGIPLNRALLLESHDKTIETVNRQFQCPIVYLYLSDASSSRCIRRIKRQTDPDANDQESDDKPTDDKSHDDGSPDDMPPAENPPPSDTGGGTDLKPIKNKPTFVTNTAQEGGYFLLDTKNVTKTLLYFFVKNIEHRVSTPSESERQSDDPAAPTGDNPPSDDNSVVQNSAKKSYFLVPTKIEVNKNVSETFDNEQDVPLVVIRYELTLTTEEGETLKILLRQKNNYFILKYIEYKNRIYRRFEEISTPTHMSYFCGILRLHSSDGAALIFRNLQFEAFKKPQDSKRQPQFSDAWHCVGYFTIGIAEGIFTMSIFISIAFFGIIWLMDLKTMSRFEDPDGKQLVIHTDD